MIRALGPATAALLLMTHVNPTGADSYMEYTEADVVVPAGTITAKESFNVTARASRPRPAAGTT